VAAGTGKEYVIVYFDGIAGDKVLAVEQVLEHDATLVSGKDTYPLAGLKVATTVVKNDRGYLKFAVPSGTKNLTLQIGTGASAQTVKLDY